MHSLKGEASLANGSQSEGSVSTPSASFEHNNTSENCQSRNVELCETPSSSNTKSDSASATGNFLVYPLGTLNILLHFDDCGLMFLKIKVLYFSPSHSLNLKFTDSFRYICLPFSGRKR